MNNNCVFVYKIIVIINVWLTIFQEIVELLNDIIKITHELIGNLEYGIIVVRLSRYLIAIFDFYAYPESIV